ncbi:MAG: hypothetical protein H7338_15895 [Candidatus Sericytochromatia bacterium]|nr:hypothetical protein [Candidatus Sericytochromatia bacterium]
MRCLSVAVIVVLLSACRAADPTAVPPQPYGRGEVAHGPYSSARLVLTYDGNTTAFSEGSAYYDPAGRLFSMSGWRPFTMQTKTTPVRITNMERIEISSTITGTGPATVPATVILAKYDSAGESTEVWADRAATLVLDRFTRAGSGPWGEVVETSGRVSGTVGGTAKPYAVTVEVTAAQR